MENELKALIASWKERGEHACFMTEVLCQRLFQINLDQMGDTDQAEFHLAMHMNKVIVEFIPDQVRERAN